MSPRTLIIILLLIALSFGVSHWYKAHAPIDAIEYSGTYCELVDELLSREPAKNDTSLSRFALRTEATALSEVADSKLSFWQSGAQQPAGYLMEKIDALDVISKQVVKPGNAATLSASERTSLCAILEGVPALVSAASASSADAQIIELDGRGPRYRGNARKAIQALKAVK